MEKINLVGLLKDCPKGMELDSTMYDNVTFGCILDGDCYPVQVQTPEGNMLLSQHGCMSLSSHAKCIIFPKGKTTWEGFHRPFKDGDVVFSGFDLISIYKEQIGGKFGRLHSHISLRNSSVLEIDKDNWTLENIRLATEEEKKKLFTAIQDNGYKWNEETKTLDKLIKPRFKVGDRIKWKGHDDSGRIEKIVDNVYHVDYGYDDGIIRVNLNMQDDYELVPNKFDIATLDPFDKVLVRDSDKDTWCASIFSHTWKDKYFCIGAWHNQCIPYEANKELLGTTNDCHEYYKNWE